MDLDLTPRQLTVYVQVARQRSFTAAAGELHLAQSVVSRTVQEIERQLRVQLLRRTSRTVELTAAGEKLLALAEQILSCHSGAAREFARYLAGDAGSVDIAALPSVAAVLLPPMMSSFLADHPEVHLRIRDGLSKAVLRDIATGAAEVGITVCEQLPVELVASDLVTDRLAAVLPPGHPLAAQPVIRWRDLADGPFIALAAASSVRARTDQAFAALGVTVESLIEAANIATVGGLVAAGLGASALPTLVHPLINFAGLSSKPLTDPVIERRLGIITRRDHDLSPPAARFVAHLQDEATTVMHRVADINGA